VAGEQDDLHQRMLLLDPSEGFDTVDTGQPHVEHDHVERRMFQCGKRLFTAFCPDGVKVPFMEPLEQGFEKIRFIVYEKHPDVGHEDVLRRRSAATRWAVVGRVSEGKKRTSGNREKWAGGTVRVAGKQRLQRQAGRRLPEQRWYIFESVGAQTILWRFLLSADPDLAKFCRIERAQMPTP
jgi:hypothetical protein